METKINKSPSPPTNFSSSPAINFNRNTSSADSSCSNRSGTSASCGPSLTPREELSNGDVCGQNGLADDAHGKGFPPNRSKKCEGFYDRQLHLTPSQLEVQQEFQKLQIQQLQQKLHQHQLQLQQTQKLLQQRKQMDVDESRPNSNRFEEMTAPESEGEADHVNGLNSDDFESKTHNSFLPRCYSAGSSGLSHLYKRSSDVFKRRENVLSNHKHPAESGFPNDPDPHPGPPKPPFENLKRHYRSENCDSRAAPPKAMDLTCKRKRSLGSGRAVECGPDERFRAPPHDDHGTSSRDQHSILKSVLTSSSPSVEGGGGRLRSHTLSVCSLQGLKRSGASSACAFSDSRRVALAKKNLAPVQRFVLDRLKEIVRFACRQPDFVQLPMGDRKDLLVQAGPRLLLLHMAELNFKFAVTLLWEPVEKQSAEKASSKESAPTQRFVETIQNFVVKCQSQSITADEYFYMRLIVLFHIGSKPLSESKLVAKQHNEAQQDLQDLSLHNFPSDRLRYSKLLLTLYTLFGIDSILVESLFYATENHRCMADFLCNELSAACLKPPFQVPVADSHSNSSMD